MRSHRPPTHLGYPARKFLVVTGRQAVVLAAGLFLGLLVLSRTDTGGMAETPLLRIGLAAVPVAAFALLALADLPRRVSRELRWRRLPKRTVYRQCP